MNSSQFYIRKAESNDISKVLQENKEAWMVQSIMPNALDKNQGKIICADAINKIE